MTGRVAAFDGLVGLGTVVTPSGTAYPFHCVAIADGSRHIEVGTEVAFEPIAKLGRWEAWALQPI